MERLRHSARLSGRIAAAPHQRIIVMGTISGVACRRGVESSPAVDKADIDHQQCSDNGDVDTKRRHIVDSGIANPLIQR